MITNRKKTEKLYAEELLTLVPSTVPKGGLDPLELRTFGKTREYLKANSHGFGCLTWAIAVVCAVVAIVYLHYFTLNELAALEITPVDRLCTWGHASIATTAYLCSRGNVEYLVRLKWVSVFYSLLTGSEVFLFAPEESVGVTDLRGSAQLSTAVPFPLESKAAPVHVKHRKKERSEYSIPHHMEENTAQHRTLHEASYLFTIAALSGVASVAYYVVIVSLYYVLPITLLIDAFSVLFTVEVGVLVVYIYVRWKRFRAYRSAINNSTTPDKRIPTKPKTSRVPVYK
jgi:hypothetical protein